MSEPATSTFSEAVETTLDTLIEALPSVGELPKDYIELIAAHFDKTAGNDIARRCLYYGMLGAAMRRLKRGRE